MEEDLLEHFSFSVLQSSAQIIEILRQNSISTEEFLAYVHTTIEKMGYCSKNMSAADFRKHLQSSRVIRSTEMCPKCNKELFIRESSEEKYESEWYCKRCSYIYYTDIAVADHSHILEAKWHQREPDFTPEEVRASRQVRDRRRAKCKKCNHRMPNGTCSACGCRIKHRTYYDIMKCPKNYW